MPPPTASRTLSVRACTIICRARGAQGQAQRGLPAARYGASQQQVRHVRAGDQQHQAANRQQDLKAAPVLFLHLGDAGAGGDHVDHLLGEHTGSPPASSSAG